MSGSARGYGGRMGLRDRQTGYGKMLSFLISQRKNTDVGFGLERINPTP
jgi:hypothetical protein